MQALLELLHLACLSGKPAASLSPLHPLYPASVATSSPDLAHAPAQAIAQVLVVHDLQQPMLDAQSAVSPSEVSSRNNQASRSSQSNTLETKFPSALASAAAAMDSDAGGVSWAPLDTSAAQHTVTSTPRTPALSHQSIPAAASAASDRHLVQADQHMHPAPKLTSMPMPRQAAKSSLSLSWPLNLGNGTGHLAGDTNESMSSAARSSHAARSGNAVVGRMLSNPCRSPNERLAPGVQGSLVSTARQQLDRLIAIAARVPRQLFGTPGAGSAEGVRNPASMAASLETNSICSDSYADQRGMTDNLSSLMNGSKQRAALPGGVTAPLQSLSSNACVWPESGSNVCIGPVMGVNQDHHHGAKFDPRVSLARSRTDHHCSSGSDQQNAARLPLLDSRWMAAGYDGSTPLPAGSSPCPANAVAYSRPGVHLPSSQDGFASGMSFSSDLNPWRFMLFNPPAEGSRADFSSGCHQWLQPTIWPCCGSICKAT